MSIRYRKWCSNGCGKKVSITSFLIPSKKRYLYKCSECKTEYVKISKHEFQEVKQDEKNKI